MSKEFNNIDDIYKNNLENFEVDFDADVMWEEVAHELDEEKRKPLILWFFFGGLVLLSLIGIFGYFHFVSDQTNVTSNFDEIATNSDLEIESNIGHDEIITFESHQTHENDLNVAKANKKIISDSKSNLSKNPKVQSGHKIFDFLSVEKNYIQVDRNVADLRSPSLNNLNLATIDNSRSSNESKVIPFNSFTKKETTFINLLESIHFTQIPYLQLKPLSFELNLDFLKDRDIVENKVKKIGVEIMGTAFFPKSQGLESYVTPLLSFSNVLSGYYYLNKNLSLFAGIEYLQIHEHFSWRDEVIERKREYRPDALFLEDNQSLEYFGDSVIVTTTLRRTRETLNKHVLWNVPIGLQYLFNLDRWQFGVNARGILNLSHSFDGWIVNEDISNTIVVNKSHARYKTKLGLGVSITPCLTFGLSENWKVKLGMPLRTSISSWFSDEALKSAKWKSAGIRVGLHFKL